MADSPAAFSPLDTFKRRHLDLRPEVIESMCATIGVDSIDTLIDSTIPPSIRLSESLTLPPAVGEQEVISRLAAIASANQVARSLIGLGYHDCVTPPVIQRNVLENPGWYTQYTPYQAEISQGRLEALLNFQTMIVDLTGLPLTNSSLLDEATAAAEAVAMCRAMSRGKRGTFFVSETCHPQTIAVIQTRAAAAGITVEIGDLSTADLGADHCGVLFQYPDTHGRLVDPAPLVARAKAAGAAIVVACDLLSLTVLTPPGEFGADIAIGSSQRFGVPLGCGGPHAAFLATHERLKRQMPGRIVGVSVDAAGEPALRLALQTREQHIRRDRATSNICTAQVLLAIMAGLYAVYHGPDGLEAIARRVMGLTRVLARGLTDAGFDLEGVFFDTLRIELPTPEAAQSIHTRAEAAGINLRRYDDTHVGVALDETCDLDTVDQVLRLFGTPPQSAAKLARADDLGDLPAPFARRSAYLQHPVFNSYHTEHELLRYLHRLQGRDLSLTTSMIPLGSCTMKLNATAQMVSITLPGFARIHPFAPAEQRRGYRQLTDELGAWLAEITGFAATSFQPNAGSQGEYTGLMVIRAWHAERGEASRNICLIPTSAHGTNPASAAMAGLKIVPVRCNERGDIDLEDLAAKAAQHATQLAALMITYPSTHGVFEAGILEICETVHRFGGLVYLDGANMNAEIGLCRPGDMGADVCHLNLHKTFAIPHGGGGPGMGPICVSAALAPFLPGHPFTTEDAGSHAIGAVAAAPWSSASILPISYAYIALLGAEGLLAASKRAILNANYMAARLSAHYPLVYTGDGGRVAHEFILDCRGFKAEAGVGVEDIAKRLMDFGFHAPTMSWPVAGTLMIEPTESESKEELDRFCDAMIRIRAEIQAIVDGELDATDNPLRNAPHTVSAVSADAWSHPYTRQQAAWPAPWVRGRKFWPSVGRVDNAYGDRNLVCSCLPMAAYTA